MTRNEKILHWLILLTFLGLCATALAAEYFFSKEAILDSFKKSLPMLGLTIEPADQFFMSRIARRDTWDIHLYFGLAFTLFLTIWLLINLVRKNKRYLIFKTIFFVSSFTFAISGIWMWLRLYYDVSEETFGLLKKVHYYAYWTFIYTLIIHIITVIYIENKKKKGVLSEMVNFKSIATISILFATLFSQNIYAAEPKSDLARWASDKNFIDGVLYIEGEKGADVLIKEVSNCPYEKCKLEDIDQTQFGTKNIEIKKPDFKKAIELLSISSESGNPLASEKLLNFLMKRIDYKSKKPSGYLLNLMKEETGLTFDEYKKIFNKTWQDGTKTKKSCLSEFINAEVMEVGILDNKKDIEVAKEHYKKATEICPTTSLYFMLSTTKLKKI